jgi:hypothetical protein
VSTSASSAATRCRRRQALSPATLLNAQRLGRDNGIGRLDLVENRFVGMKSRGMYETPGRHDPAARAPRHRVDHARPRRAHLKDELMPRYAELIYNGFWFSPGARDAPGLIDRARSIVTARCGSSSTRAASTSRPHLALLALRPGPRHLRGRRSRLRPPRRGRLHQAERASTADVGATPAQDGRRLTARTGSEETKAQ